MQTHYAVDGTITLPLYRGELRETGENVWYIVTDTTDQVNAAALGITTRRSWHSLRAVAA